MGSLFSRSSSSSRESTNGSCEAHIPSNTLPVDEINAMSEKLDVNQKLWQAVLDRNEDVVRQLLERRGDPNYRSKYKDLLGFEWDKTTLLMVASDKGYKSIVQLLHNSGASVNETDASGQTALHYAARRVHHEIVLDLIKMQANVNAVNKYGQTPLHHAAINGDERTVQHLLEWKADPNFQDWDGDTPLHDAARRRHGGVVQMLIKKNANPDIKNKNGNTPLHDAAIWKHGGVFQLLLENNANPDLKNKDGKYPHEYAMSDLRQQMLRYWEEYRLAQLLKLGKISLKIVKGYVVGSSKAGKTTFALAITGKGDPSERTPGIEIMEVILEKLGYCLKVHDLAGHDLFHTTHSFFFGGVSALFIYIVDTDCSRDEMLADAIYWLAFIISGRLAGGPPVYLLILGSRGGGEDQEARQFMLNSVTRELRKKFGGRFTFILGDNSLVLDMRQAGSMEMEEVKKCLAIGVQKCLERVTDVPLVCHEVQAVALPELRAEKAAQSSSGIPAGQFTEESEFHTRVLKVSDALKDASLYASLIHYLEEWGEIVDAGSHIVINTLWLCRSLMAPVLASKADPRSIEFKIRMRAGADGTATLDDIARVLEDFRLLNGTPAVDPKAGIHILCHMGLAFPTEKQGVYRFPALIQEHKPERVWMKTQYTSLEPHSKVYVGIRLQCQSDIEIITPAVMPLLQGHVANQKSEMEVIMWNGGMLVQRICEPTQPKVEALVSISDKKRAIRSLDLITRGPAHCQRDAKQFLDKLHHITMQMLDKKSPGTLVEKQHLSHHQISQHIDTPLSYSQEEVALAKQDKGVLSKKTGDQIITDTVIDLLAVDDDHIIYKLQAMSKYCSDHWQAIGCILLSSTKSQVTELAAAWGDGATTGDKFCHILETWIRRQWRTATLDTFLKVCDTVDKRIRQQVNRELEVIGRDPLSTADMQESIDQEETGTTTEQLQAVAGGDNIPPSLATKAGQKVDSAQLMAVARQIASVWEEIASQLSPDLFSIGKLKEIWRDNYSRGTVFQARVMLEKWSEECGSEATCRHLIDSLCQMDQRSVAADVFSSELVDFVVPP